MDVKLPGTCLDTFCFYSSFINVSDVFMLITVILFAVVHHLSSSGRLPQPALTLCPRSTLEISSSQQGLSHKYCN